MKKHLLKFYKYFNARLYLLSYPAFSQLTLAEWNFPNNPDDALVNIAIPANSAQTIYTTAELQYYPLM